MRKQSLELRYMKAIVMLPEELSYTKVARRLGISQPAVTRIIQDAEERLGRKLFERTEPRICLCRGAVIAVNSEYHRLHGYDDIMEYDTSDLFIDLLYKSEWQEALSII